MLCHGEDCYSNNAYAKSLLRYFVKNCLKLYREKFLIYNTYNLIHFPDDVLNFGPLDTFSAFSFENYLFTLKKKLKKLDEPLQQVYRRIVEESKSDFTQKSVDSDQNQLAVANKNLKVSSNLDIPSYDTITYKNFILALTRR